ncbi:hypothetical protein RhiirC2_717513 [Rhizophagus irregularis]|uniref:Uncharacterized protein n=1 Tax=Rhizophagus irregularis TaxID=588596 RepID=A0A2N1MM22_9GLOM|nr:hypothetical protein RhiirC2_717513 [Rhizophagus irregularis]
MSTITTHSKAKSTDKSSLTDSEMVKEVYATDTTKTSELITSSDRPNKIKNIEKKDDPNAMVVEPTETTTLPNNNKQSREEENGSTNELMETDKEIISNLEDHQNTTNPQKGKQIKNFHSNKQKLLQNYDFEIKRHRQNNSGCRNNRYAPKPP